MPNTPHVASVRRLPTKKKIAGTRANHNASTTNDLDMFKNIVDSKRR